MRKRICKILVTGGAGFIGSAFVRLLVKKGIKPVICDKLTYAGDLERLREVKGKYKFYKTDICDLKNLEKIFKIEKPSAVVHFAAETHVDRSIIDPTVFLKTNIIGTQNLLDLSRKYKITRFIHISTDEVYGDILKGSFTEESPIKPNSPYAASKAAADLLIRSYVRTYDFPAIIIRPSNNYGPWQYPEKLIPVAISKVINNKKIPVYANGLNVREWLYVSDCAEGIIFLLNNSKAEGIYNLGSGHREKNINTVKQILRILGKPVTMLEFVKDRPGHDWRYSLDSSRIRRLGWQPKTNFVLGLRNTVKWNTENENWLRGKA
ncbi:MAG: dTDP-glucose 4,6-dehydratase [Candidatus Omnitrophica bacterium]|nr:dTDP-glucose 4,6-dehydratase [Candidatus Omnitrophota bacterium]